MSYYDDDFYYEPSEFEQQVESFKESLLNAVKEEIKEEMERLRKENAELQEIKKNFDQIKADYREKEWVLENKMKEASQEAAKARLNELMKQFEVILYRADWDYVTGPKCDRCNEHRKIEFTSPSGKAMTESCACAEKTKVHKPGMMILKEFRKRNSRGNEIIAWYEPYRDSDDGFTYSSSTVAEVIFEKGMSFENLKWHFTFFRDEQDCQAYCDWLNAKEAVDS